MILYWQKTNLVLDKAADVGHDMGMDTLRPPSEVLRDVIRRSDRSLNDIAKGAEIDTGILSRFMRNERGMTLRTMDAVCRVLGVECRLVKPRKRT